MITKNGMNMIEHRGRMVLFICLLVFFCNFSHAQDSVKTLLKSEAAAYFQDKDYAHALPLYRELLSLYPKDPNYQYHTALCLLNLNRDPEEVIDLLRMVSADDENTMATFYLARAYHLQYDFEDAIKAYSRFLTMAKKSDIKRFKVQRLIEMAKNGIEYTRKAKSFTVKHSVITPVYQLENAYTISTNGKVIRKPVEFNTKADQKMNFSPLMYLPAYTEINEFIFVSGYHESGNKGKDIFRIRNINHQMWGLPEPLNEVINTASDEDYPFFDTPASTLYFSSEGHSSMGGYDIFRSVYDWNTKTWSKPENLGFPINSPYDDFMLVTDDPGLTAQFASNRNTGPGMVMLYRIVLKENETGERLLTVDDIRELSTLAVTTAAPENPAVEPDVMKSIPSGTAGAEDVITPSFSKNEYNRLIAEALSLQVQADSLSLTARDERILAREIPDNEAKKQAISVILDLEREAKKIQRLADEKFLEARKMKNSADTLPEGDTNLVFHREVNGIKVYQYKVQDAEEILPAKPGTGSDGNTLTGNRDSTAMNQFEILENSPYGLENPIPTLPETNKGLIYRIQLGVFSKPKEISSFGGLYPLYEEWIADKNVYKYYTGGFSSSASVADALEKARSNGFPDAFVVAFFDAEPVTTEKAREIEFEGLRF